MQRNTRMTAALLAAGGTLVTAIPAEAGGNGPQVQGARVRHGSAKFDRFGNHLRITAGRNTIIDYSRFDIPVGSSVQFQQPDAKSRVLNRINSAAPSMIMGSLMANGKVYFINRAGVVFGKDARIDVAGLFAASGKITNRDFLTGRDRITEMSGTVRNYGDIKAGEVILAGRTVVNDGTITTKPGGLVALVSGDSVTVRRNGSNVGIRVAGGSAALADGAGITNTGTIRSPGGRIIATAGDLASLAVDLEGSILAQMVEVDAQRGGVRIAGEINATGAANNALRGGTVEISGRNVDIESTADIDASGPRGGGTVHLGGGARGQDAGIHNARTLNVADGATVSADATSSGSGGEIVLWSEELTNFHGSLSARGAGANGGGGLIEVSGKNNLYFNGDTTVLGSGLGANGTVLLDPVFLTVRNLTDALNFISIPTINGMLAGGNVVIATSGDQSLGIDWTATSALAGLNSSSLTLDAVLGGQVKFTTAPSFGTWAGDFNVNAPAGPIVVGANFTRPSGGNMTLTAGAGSAISLNSGVFSTKNGLLTFNGPVQLGTNVTITAGPGNINFNSTVAGFGGNRNLTVNNTGATFFADDVSSIAQMQTISGGSTTFAGDVALNGNSTFNENVFFTAGAHNVTNTGTGKTTFNGFVDGPGSLSISSGTGTILFDDVVGGTLTDLDIVSSGAVTFNGLVEGAMPLFINTTGTTKFNGAVGGLVALNSIDIVGGTTVVSGGLMRTSGAQNYLDVAMGAHGDFEATDFTVNSTFSRFGATARDVNFNVSGTASLLGATTNIRNLTSDAGGTLFVAAPVTLTGLLTVNDTLSLGAASVVMGAQMGFQLQNVVGNGNSLTLNSGNATVLNGNITGINNLTTNAAGATTLGADINASGTVTFGDALTLAGVGQTRTITTSGGNISLNGTVNGANTLALNLGTGSATFGAAVGGATALDAIDVNSTGAVTFLNTVNGATDLDVSTTGLTTFLGAIGATTALNHVHVSGPVVVSGGSVRTTGDQSYGSMLLGANTTLTSTGGADIHLTGNLNGARNFTSTTTGNTIFDGTVGNAIALTSVTANTGAVQFNGGSVETTGAQSYGAATLGADLALTSTGGGAITFTSTVDGPFNLQTSSTGNTNFNGAVGAGTALTSVTAGPTVFNNGNVTTTGGQTYGVSTLNAATLLTSTGGGDIAFTGNVNGANTFQSITGGDTIFGARVGNTTALTSVTALGSVQMNGASIRTTGAQTYGAVVLGNNVTLSSTGGGDINFNGTVTSGSTNDLFINTAGDTQFDGDLTGLGDLITDAPGTNSLNADITAAGQITLNGATTLSGALRSIFSTGDTVTFGGTVDGPTDLTVNAAGITTFNGVVGGTTALAQIFVGGDVQLNGGAVTTVGDQLFGDAILGANTVLTSNAGGVIQFKGTLDGPFSLNSNTSGNTMFMGDVGANTALTSITVPGAMLMNGDVIRTSGGQLYGDATLGNNVLVTSTGGGAIDFTGTVTAFSSDSLTVNTSGVTTFGGTVSALGDLVTDAAGSNAVNADITAAGLISLGGDTDLTGAARTITSTGGAVNFGGAVNGATNLTVNSVTGNTFGGAVGGGIALASLTSNGDTAINGGGVTTTGLQSYMGNATIDGDTVLTSTGGGGVLFNGTVTGTGVSDLTVNTSGATTFNGNVTGLGELTTDAAGTNTVNGNITTGDDIILGGNTALVGAVRTINSAGAVNFGGTLDGATGLTVTSANGTTFDGAVGAGTALNSLTVIGGSTINGGSVTTNGAQSLGNTILGASTNLTSNDNMNIAMGDVTGGGNFLGVHTGGTTNLNGSLTGLSGLLVDGGGNTNIGGDIASTGDISILDAAMLMAGDHTIGSSGGAILFGNTLDGPGGLDISSAMGSTFMGQVGALPKLETLTTNGTVTFQGGLVWSEDLMTLMGPTFFTADTGITVLGTLNIFGNANSGLFDLTLNANQINFASGVTVTGRNIILNGPSHGLGTLGFNASETLELRGDMFVDGTIDLGTPNLIVLGGDLSANGTIDVKSFMQIDGDRTITARNGGNAFFRQEINGTTFEGDSLWVYCSGLTAFDVDEGITTKLFRLETDHPGTILVSPFANAVIVIYGELTPGPGPGGLGGGVALAQALSSVQEQLNAILRDGRKTGQIDWARSLRVVVAADLDRELNASGVIGAAGVAADATEPE